MLLTLEYIDPPPTTIPVFQFECTGRWSLKQFLPPCLLNTEPAECNERSLRPEQQASVANGGISLREPGMLFPS